MFACPSYTRIVTTNYYSIYIFLAFNIDTVAKLHNIIVVIHFGGQ